MRIIWKFSYIVRTVFESNTNQLLCDLVTHEHQKLWCKMPFKKIIKKVLLKIEMNKRYIRVVFFIVH